MPNVRLVARPDAHMVEVPLDLEAELARGFEGSALLVATGLPRKVHLKAQRDQIKLSTAYRADQLLVDIVRMAMQGAPKDLERVGAAARAFLRTVRERRQDGASLRIESGEKGRIDISESMPQAPSRPRPQPVPAGPPPSPLERRLAELEGKVARLLAAGDAVIAFEERISRAERRLAELEARPVVHAAPHAEGQRGLLRRATAVDAYADGLRRELREKISAALEESVRQSSRLDHAAGLALEAETILGESVAGPRSDELRSGSAQAMAREEGLRRMHEEVELYSSPDLPIAERLLARFQNGPEVVDPTPVLESLVQPLASATMPEEELAGWLTRAAAVCAWTLIDPQRNETFDGNLHDSRESGEAVQLTLLPGVKRGDGSVLLRARVVAGPRTAEVAPPRPPPPREEPKAPESGSEPEEVALAAAVVQAVEAEEVAADDPGWAQVARGPTAFEAEAERPTEPPKQERPREE